MSMSTSFASSVLSSLGTYRLYVQGKYCGDFPEDEGCRGCSLDECATHAYTNKSVSFSYRGTGIKWCRLCDVNDLANLHDYPDWETYVTGVKT